MMLAMLLMIYHSTDPGALPAGRPPDWGGSEFERPLGRGNNYDRFEVRFARLQNNFFARFGGRSGNPNNFELEPFENKLE